MLLPKLMILVASVFVLPKAIATEFPLNVIQFNGIAQFDRHCSASLIRFRQSQPNDKALLLTNAHCMRYHEEMVTPDLIEAVAGVDRGEVGHYLVNYMVKPNWVYDVVLKNYKTGQSYATKAEKVLYVTRTLTDMALIELDETYAFLQRQGIHSLVLSDKPAVKGEAIAVATGLLKKDRQFNCKVAEIVPILIADITYFRNAIRYSEGCDVFRGTSGSPVISIKTGEVIGINSLRNDITEKSCIQKPHVGTDGKVTNPNALSVCEYNAGKIRLNPVQSGYATETHQLYSCLNKNRKLDLTLPTCKLFGSPNTPN